MPTATEKRALGFFAGVLLLGAGVRVVRAASNAAPDASGAARAQLHRQIAAVDSARGAPGGRAPKGGRRRGAVGNAPRSSPGPHGSRRDSDSTPGPVYYLRRAPAVERMGGDSAAAASGPRDAPAGVVRIDVDVAPAVELERLPRIGPALARRIVADREANGPFGSLEALTRVRGIGPATARQLAAYVTFSLSRRLSGEGDRTAGATGGRGRRLRKPRSP